VSTLKENFRFGDATVDTFFKLNSSASKSRNIFVVAMLTVALLFVPNTDTAEANSQPLDLQFDTMTFSPEAELTRANANLVAGFSRRYENVVNISGQEVDALVTIVSVTGQQNNEIGTFDQYDNSGALSAHASINGSSNNTVWSKFRIDFLADGTNTPVVITNLRSSIADIDKHEFSRYWGISGYRMAVGTNLRINTSSPAGTAYFTSTTTGTSNTDEKRIAEVTYDAVSSMNVSFGCLAGAINTVGVGGSCGFTIRIGTVPRSLAFTDFRVTPVVHTLTYNANGGSGTVPSPTTGTSSVSVSGNTGSLAKPGQVFLGWNTAANGTGTSFPAGSNYLLNDSITVFAQYGPAPVTDPIATSSSKSVIPGESVEFPPLYGSGGLAAPAAGGPAIVSACLLVANVCDADNSVQTADGIYTLNTVSGIVSYVATTSAVAGNQITISYRVTDSLGGTATSTLHPVVPPAPVLTPDVSSGSWDVNQVIQPLANDTNIPAGYSLVPSTLWLCNASETAPNCSTSTLTVAGEGTYTVIAGGGVVFDPLPTFSGPATPISYSVRDNVGRAVSSTITVTVRPGAAPTATPDTQSVLANVANGPVYSVDFKSILVSTLTQSALAAPGSSGLTSVCLLVGGVCDADGTVTTADGTYVLNPTTGVVSFTPAIGVTSATSLAGISYQVTDGTGATASSTLQPVIPPAPTANPDYSAGAMNTDQVISPIGNDLAGPPTSPLVASSVKLCGASMTPPNCTATSLVVAGEGTYTVDAGGSIKFVPVTDYTGLATAVTYQISDTLGQVASSTYQPLVLPQPAPAASPDFGTEIWSPTVVVVMNLLTNDSPGVVPPEIVSSPTVNGSTSPSVVADPASVKLCSVGQASPNCTASTVTTADGTYTITGQGIVTFDPIDGFTGTVTVPVGYQFSNIISGTWETSNGTPYNPQAQTASSIITPTITPPPPVTANPDTTSGLAGQAQSINLATNDGGLSGQATVKLCLASDTAPNCSQSRITVAGVGTYEVNGTVVTFTPEMSFSGTAPALTYVITDSLGKKAFSTYTAAVTPPTPPSATPQSKTVLSGEKVDFSPIIGSGSLATAGSGDLIAPLTCLVTRDQGGAITGCTATLTTADGFWSLNAATSVVSYFSNTGSSAGSKIGIEYRVTDSLGQTAISTLSPIVPSPPVANPDQSSGPMDTPQTLGILGNDLASAGALVASQTKLCNNIQVAPDCDSTTVEVDEQGTFTIANTGVVTFTPAASFSGEVDMVFYIVVDSLGQKASATISVEVDPAVLTVQAPQAPAPAPAPGPTPDPGPAPGPGPGPGPGLVIPVPESVSPLPIVPMPKPTPKMPSAFPDFGFGPLNQAILLQPILNDKIGDFPFVAGSLSVCDLNCEIFTSVSPIALCDTNCGIFDSVSPIIGKSLMQPEGKWTVNQITGEVTFTPTLDWFGTATINYVLFDVEGNRVESTLTVEIPPAVEEPVAELADTGTVRDSGPLGLAALLIAAAALLRRFGLKG
jgi:CshA-type fibril repeat protein